MNRSWWPWFNIALVLLSLGFAIGTGFVLSGGEDDCGMIKMCLWITQMLHITNFFAGVINIMNKETKCCFGNLVMAFGMMEIGILVFMQVVFFFAQKTECLNTSTGIYFWLYSQILVVYFVLLFLLCCVFRPSCQDPELEEKSWEEQIVKQRIYDNSIWMQQNPNWESEGLIPPSAKEEHVISPSGKVIA